MNGHRRFDLRLDKIVILSVAWLLPLYACSPAVALISLWNSDSGGNFTDSSKWVNGVPGPGDLAMFNRGGGITYSVTFPGGTFANPVNYSSNSLSIGANEVSF